MSTGTESDFSADLGFVDNSGAVGSCHINSREDKFDCDFGTGERHTQSVYLHCVVPASEHYRVDWSICLFFLLDHLIKLDGFYKAY